MKTKVYMVRHAETIGNVEKRLTGITEFDITENGKKMIEKLTKRLSNIKFHKFYSSTSERAIETIEPLAILNNKPIIKIQELREMDFGKYDGLKWEEVNRIDSSIKMRQLQINEISGIPEQETTEEVANRMEKCINDIIKKNKGKTILICSHGVAMEAFFRRILNVPFSEEREKFCQHNTAINEFEVEDEEINIITMADISHIKD